MRCIAQNFYNTFSTAVVKTVTDVSKTMSRVKASLVYEVIF